MKIANSETAALTDMSVSTRLDESVVQSRRREILNDLLRDSRYVKSANFVRLHDDDLTQLFEAYDATFFRGACRAALGPMKLTFRVSSRLTRAAGKTFRYIPRLGGLPFFEIAISSTLLFQTFREVDRRVTVCGCECDNRLEAMSRVFEHELIHLVELVCWHNSECAARRFQGIAGGIFGHKAHTHDLITQNERAASHFGVRNGARVTFEFEGHTHTGIVNRITRRATILVEAPTGQQYSDGRRYLKFYIPLEHLRPA